MNPESLSVFEHSLKFHDPKEHIGERPSERKIECDSLTINKSYKLTYESLSFKRLNRLVPQQLDPDWNTWQVGVTNSERFVVNVMKLRIRNTKFIFPILSFLNKNNMLRMGND